MSNYWLLLAPIAIFAFLLYANSPAGQVTGPMQHFYYVSEGPARQILIETPGAIAVRGYVPRSKVIRQQILDYFPNEINPAVRDIDKTRVYSVRRALLENLKEENYVGTRIGCDVMDFFQRDQDTAIALLELGCLAEMQLPGAGVYGDINVVNPTKLGGYYPFTDIGYIPCNENLKEVSRHALGDLLEADRLIAEGTVGVAKCREADSKFSLALAAGNRAKGEPLAELDSYLAAVRKSVSCYCR